MKKIRKNALVCAVLVLSLLLSLCSPLFAVSAAPLAELKENLDSNGDGKINYLAIGSAAASGVGVDKADSYAAIVKNKLEASGKGVDFSDFAIDGMRAEELQYLFNESFEGDAYTEENFLGANGIFETLGGVDSLRESLYDKVSDAEVITLDIGTDSYLEYALSYIFSDEYDADFNRFGAGLRSNVYEIKGRFEDVLNGYVKDADSEEVGPLLQRAIDGLAYALVGFASSFDDVLTHVYAINPEVKITVVNLRNPLTGLTATMDGLDFTIPLTEIYGALVDLANVYIGSLSEYSESYYFAYAGDNGQPDSFVNEISRFNGNLSSLSADVLANLASYAGDSESAQAALASLVRLGLNYTNLDLTAVAEAPLTSAKTLDGYVKAILNDSKSQGYSLSASSEYRAITSSDALMTLLAVSVRRDFSKLTSLPTKTGHGEIANAVISAIENSTVGSEVVEKDMNEVYGFLFRYLGFDRETLLDLEYAFKPYYTCDGDSYYVAIGDGSAMSSRGYVEKLAEKLGLNGTTVNNRRYKKFAKNDLTPTTALENINEYRTELLAADLITLSFNNTATTSYMMDQLSAALGTGGKVKDNDWSAILGPDTAAMVDEVVEMLKTELAKGEFGEDITDALVVAIESYAYAYAQRLVAYPALIEAIRMYNRDALILIVGTYNDMKDVELVLGDMTLPLGNYVQYLIDIANLETLALSILSDKTAYIAAPDVETKMTNKTINIDTNNIIATGIAVGRFISDIKQGKLNPSDDGHAYVANTVINSIVKVGPHACVYDNDCDNRCDICKEKRTVKGHQYDAVCDTNCNVCDARRVAKAHVYGGVCDNDCDVCGLTREVPEHTFGGVCDTECNVCGETRQVGSAHSFGEWTVGDGERSRACSVCGTREVEAIDGGEEFPTWAIIAIAVGALALLGGGGFAVYTFVIKKKP